MQYIVLGGMMVVLSPFIVPMAARESFIINSLQKKLRKIQLGGIQEDIVATMDLPYKTTTMDQHIVLTYDIRMGRSTEQQPQKRIVFVFKDNKLIAYVWGLAPTRN